MASIGLGVRVPGRILGHDPQSGLLGGLDVRAGSAFRPLGIPPWMEECGVRFQPSLSGTLSLSRTNAFFLGGGKALVNAYCATHAHH
ncbi:hypothetical protein FBZ82_113123 [Azospirillum brasilense]|uniref:Uncharacterized protein n=1 Tax=Azospirillum brasilense TaxID=192 RepID=A0A560ASV9_AZOBR|nr:hypothetical protein [Azospirillum brasilense]TWA63465.1 hypothetical protein FBZ82_113123 [Azospirillum brasilense]